MVGFQSDVPFPAIVGQDRLKRALLAVAANDAIDGLLIQGEKGTAKSTAVRGLVDLLPTQRAVADCPYGCPPDDPSRQCDSCRTREDPPVEERPVPLVTVPLGATRERVVGSLSLSEALDGDPTFLPGLLAQANRGFLYVDEVNLLDDHLVDVLLDAAASGVNRVERDGVSETHPADFTLIGTMNPEEGDLRPQLRDRFALQVAVTGSDALEDRIEIVESALARDEREGSAPHEASIEDLRGSIQEAREHLDAVALDRDQVATIAEVCVDAGVDGHRGDIAAARTARTLAGLDGRGRVTEADVKTALRFALPHRLQSRPFEETTPLEDVLDDHFGEDAREESPNEDTAGDSEGGSPDGAPDDQEGAGEPGDGASEPDAGGGSAADGASETEEGGASDSADPSPSSETDAEEGERDSQPGPEAAPKSGGESRDAGSRAGAGEQLAGAGDDAEGQGAEDAEEERTARPPSKSAAQAPTPQTSEAPELPVDSDAAAAADPAGSGRAEVDPGVNAEGPKIRSEPAESAANVDVTASVTAAAKRGADAPERRDLRQSVRAGSATALVVFVVDASASMRPAMQAAKGTVLELLKESYQKRDEVAFVAFAGEDAEVLLPPTDSVSLAARHLKDLPVGDRTPLPAGLRTARDVLDRADPAASVAVVVTDGRTNVASGSPTQATREAAQSLGQRADELLVVDASQPDDRGGLVEDLVTAAEARVIPLAELSEDSVHAMAQSARE